MSRDDLIREAVRALHGCLEAEKELDLANTSVAVVGEGERFHVLEAGELAPFLAGLGPAVAGGAMPVEEEAEGKEADVVVEGAEGGAAIGAGGGGSSNAATDMHTS